MIITADKIARPKYTSRFCASAKMVGTLPECSSRLWAREHLTYKNRNTKGIQHARYIIAFMAKNYIEFIIVNAPYAANNFACGGNAFLTIQF